MSVEQHGKTWRVSYRFEGKAYKETFTSADAAYARDEEIKAAKKVGTFCPPHELLDAEGSPTQFGKGLTVTDMMQIIMSEYSPVRWKPNVAACNRARINNYIIPLLGNERLSELTVRRLERFFAQLSEQPEIGHPGKTVGPSVMEKVKSLLRTMMIEASRLGYISIEQANIISLVRTKPYSSAPVVVWSQSEYLRAVDAAEQIQMRVWLMLSAQASARIGENLGLKWDDVEFLADGSAAITYRWQLQRIKREEMVDNTKLTVYEEIPGGYTTKDKVDPQTVLCLVGMKSKNDAPPAPRTVFVGPELAGELKKLKSRQDGLKMLIGDMYDDRGFVLAQDNGRPYEEHTIRKYLKQLCEENGLPVITPHAMRHWSVSFKLLLTGDVKAVQADTGQKNTQMVLDRYAHAFVEEQKKMAFAVENGLQNLADRSQDVPTQK